MSVKQFCLALLLGNALACLLLALTLIQLTVRFASDFDEVIYVWQYVRALVVVSILSLAVIGCQWRR